VATFIFGWLPLTEGRTAATLIIERSGSSHRLDFCISFHSLAVKYSPLQTLLPVNLGLITRVITVAILWLVSMT
jgi:hypothetical protein